MEASGSAPAQFVGAIVGVGVAATMLDAYAQVWTVLWIYFTAPLLGMLAAAQLYVATQGMQRVLCAKLHHDNTQRCIFRCRYSARGH